MKEKLTPWRGLVGLVGVWMGVFGYLMVAQHLGLKTQMNDLGNAVQAIDNTTKGRLMRATNNGELGLQASNRLGGHANLIYLALVPIYALAPSPVTLMLFQVVVVGLGAVGLYGLSKIYFGENSWLNLVGPVAYLLHPVVQDVTLFDFHAVTVAMPLLIWAMYLVAAKRWLLMWVALLLVMLTKEDMPLLVGMIGAYLAVFEKERKRGVAVMAVAAGYFLAVTKVMMPMFQQAKGWVLVDKRYGYLGGSVEEMVVNMVLRPGEWMGRLVSEKGVAYVAAMGLPVAGVAAYGWPVLVVAVPSLLINLLSTNRIMHVPFGFYYAAPVMAAVMVATVMALGKAYERKRKVFPRVVGMVMAASVVASVGWGPAPYSLVSSIKEFEVSEHAKGLGKVKELVPEQASVSVQNNLGAQFAQRKDVIAFPYGVGEAEYVVIDVSDPYEVIRLTPRQRNFVYITGMGVDDYGVEVEALWDRDDYGVVYFSEDGYVVLKRGGSKESQEEARQMVKRRIGELEERYRGLVSRSSQGS